MEKEIKKDSKMKVFIKEWLIPLATIALVVVLIRTFLVTPGVVNGHSMDDTLHDKDIVIVNKIALKGGIDRFNIVVVNYDGETIIKRVIGLPNETVEYKDDVLYINGAQVKTDIEFEHTNDFTLTAKDDEYIVLGDNRDISKDSRSIGPVNIEDIKGKVSLRIFPLNKIGIVK